MRLGLGNMQASAYYTATLPSYTAVLQCATLKISHVNDFVPISVLLGNINHFAVMSVYRSTDSEK